MITYTTACPACGVETRFEAVDSQIYAESLPELKTSPYSRAWTEGSADHELYGYCLSHCPGCRANVIVHFNIVLHRYLALLETLLPEAYAHGTDIPAQELFRRLAGDLRSYAVDPVAEVIDL